MSSKRFKKLPSETKKMKADMIEKLLPLIKKNCTAKFDESIDLSFQINNKQKKNEINLRTIINMPGGTGKKVKVAVLCDDGKLNDAKKSGADIFGSDDLIKNITSGKINFDKLICTPSMMSKMGKLGKILGPKGLMPNPKLGTVSDNIGYTVKKIKNKLVEIKSDKDGNVGISIGRKSFTPNSY